MHVYRLSCGTNLKVLHIVMVEIPRIPMKHVTHDVVRTLKIGKLKIV